MVILATMMNDKDDDEDDDQDEDEGGQEASRSLTQFPEVGSLEIVS